MASPPINRVLILRTVLFLAVGAAALGWTWAAEGPAAVARAALAGLGLGAAALAVLRAGPRPRRLPPGAG